jgi:hypothetical protein
MSADDEADRCKPPADQNRELASVARQLAEHCLAIDLAVAREDFDVVCASVEMAKVLYQRIAALYLQMLAARTIPSRISERSSL